jgi:Mn2+/Fe2+ NRAMP family transporter
VRDRRPHLSGTQGLVEPQITSVRDRLAALLRSILPGVFLFGFCIGTGSVTAMATAGAEFGMALLWTVLLSCLITFYLIDLFGRFTLVTGETALAAFRRHMHPAVGYFFIVALTAHVCGSVIGVMGILSDVLSEWSGSILGVRIPPVGFAVFFITVVYLLFLDGRTKIFQQALAAIVAVMSACFLVNLLFVAPPPADILRGLVPRVPETVDGRSAFLVIASMVGTTVFSGLFILRGSLVRDAGWTMAEYGTQRRDAAFAAAMMFLVSAAIMAAGAGTLHAQGLRLNNVSEMITLLRPVAGTFAVGIFVMGIVAAGVSSQFPNVTLLPWMLNDYYGRRASMRRTDYRLIVLGISLLGLLVPVLGGRPILVMMVSQAFGALVLPVTVACLLVVGNRRSLMREHAFGMVTNTLLGLTLAFALTMSWMSYRGLLATLSGLL